MSAIALVILIVWIPLFGLGVGIELLRVVRAIGRRDWATMRYFGFLLVQHGLVLACFILFVETRRASNVPIYLLISALLLKIAGSRPPLKAFVGEEPRKGSAQQGAAPDATAALSSAGSGSGERDH